VQRNDAPAPDLSHSQPLEAPPTARPLARRVLFAFLVTFIVSRVIVFLIMARKLPDFYLYLRGTHIHHLNYGIFLLVAVGSYLLFKPDANRRVASALFGIGLALTFDEFGMWLHLGGSYWQRASWDAVAVIAALLGLFAFGPTLARYRPRHWAEAALVLALAGTFFYFLPKSFKHAQRVIGPKLEEIETTGPR
jgi:hypothetical protein